ncbi:hypothetical protein SRHO_G00111570 [Serrasalmus rhombeus]
MPKRLDLGGSRRRPGTCTGNSVQPSGNTPFTQTESRLFTRSSSLHKQSLQILNGRRLRRRGRLCWMMKTLPGGEAPVPCWH